MLNMRQIRCLQDILSEIERAIFPLFFNDFQTNNWDLSRGLSEVSGGSLRVWVQKASLKNRPKSKTTNILGDLELRDRLLRSSYSLKVDRKSKIEIRN